MVERWLKMMQGSRLGASKSKTKTGDNTSRSEHLPEGDKVIHERG